MQVLSESFQWDSLTPVVVMLVVAAVIPIILSLLKIKFIPVLVIEIAMGMILANIPYFKNMFTSEGTLNPLMNGLYTIGLAFMLFLSGMEIDYSVLKRQKKGNNLTLPTLKMSWILVILVILVSFVASFFFQNLKVLPKNRI